MPASPVSIMEKERYRAKAHVQQEPAKDVLLPPVGEATDDDMGFDIPHCVPGCATESDHASRYHFP